MTLYLDEAAWEESVRIQEERINNDPQLRANYEAWCAWVRQFEADAEEAEE